MYDFARKNKATIFLKQDIKQCTEWFQLFEENYIRIEKEKNNTNQVSQSDDFTSTSYSFIKGLDTYHVLDAAK
jgi:hypothetical protein